MRGLALLSLTLLVACKAQAFACGGDGECFLGGEPGVCVAGNCAYPDAECPSGFRYPAGLGGGLAGECVSPDEVDATGDDTGSSAGSSTSGSSAPPLTTSGADGTSSSTTEDLGPTTSDGASSSSTGEKESASVTSLTTDNSTTSGPLTCADLACEDCMECVENEACAVEAGGCQMADFCPETTACLASCVATSDCDMNCCAGLPNPTVAVVLALHECQLEACADPCARGTEAVCVP